MQHKGNRNEREHSAHDNAKNERIPLIRKLEWNFWPNTALSVLGLVIAIFLLTPVFDFMSESTKIYCIALGFSGVLCVLSMFVAHSIVVHREGRSSIQLEAKEQAEKAALKDKLDRLDDRLEKTEQAVAMQAQRTLSESEKNAIAESLSKFRGQWFSVFAISSDPEALSYGYCFIDALTRAGWDSHNKGVGQQVFSANFENIKIAINRADIQGGKISDAALALLQKLTELKITSMSAFDDPGTGVQKGEIRIYIAPRHVKDIPATTQK